MGLAVYLLDVKQIAIPALLTAASIMTGRTFTMADPDGYRVTVYEKDQPLFWPPRRG